MALVRTRRRLASSSNLRCSSSAWALQHLRLSRLDGQDGDDVALLDMRAAADPQFLQQAIGARKGDDLAIGLGAAGKHQLAAVGDHIGIDHGDAESACRPSPRLPAAPLCFPPIHAG